jgi:hypothetical protein
MNDKAQMTERFIVAVVMLPFFDRRGDFQYFPAGPFGRCLARARQEKDKKQD